MTSATITTSATTASPKTASSATTTPSITIPSTTEVAPEHAHARLVDALGRADRARGDAVHWFHTIAVDRLYRSLGHASIDAYARERLGFTDNRLAQFKRLSEAMTRLPALDDAVASGRLGWTKAVLVARVATPATVDDWLARAETLGRRKLADAVSAARMQSRNRRERRRSRQLPLGDGGGSHEAPSSSGPASRSPAHEATTASPGASTPLSLGLAEVLEETAADPPTDVCFRLDGEQRARYEALVEILRKRGRRETRAELLLAALEALAGLGSDQTTADCPPAQIVVQRCPDCEAAHAVTSRGLRRLDRSAAEALACDAEVVDGASGRARRTIAPTVRRRVLARDGHRCQAPGCDAMRFLEVHHIVPLKNGGSSRPDNLVTLCSRCHRHLHETIGACAGTNAQRALQQWLGDDHPEPVSAAPASGSRPRAP